MRLFCKVLIFVVCLFSVYVPVNASFNFLGYKEFIRIQVPVRENASTLKSMDGSINASFDRKTLTISINHKAVFKQTFADFKYGNLTVVSFYDDTSKKNFYKISLAPQQDIVTRENLYLTLVGFDESKKQLVDYINLKDYYDPFGATKSGFAGIEINPANPNQLMLVFMNLGNNQEYRYYLEWNSKNNKFDIVDEGYASKDRLYRH